LFLYVLVVCTLELATTCNALLSGKDWVCLHWMTGQVGNSKRSKVLNLFFLYIGNDVFYKHIKFQLEIVYILGCAKITNIKFRIYLLYAKVTIRRFKLESPLACW
jgi:hypothetical protein